jgi:hypothetical protein
MGEVGMVKVIIMLSAREAMSENVILWPVREFRELEMFKTGMLLRSSDLPGDLHLSSQV